ncbi:MAG: FAD-linked oxidase C-terminal domain-containing protein [bacterium]|nr:FAD-linked oxidase C-terminal domain-containing protein [bacterium]
MEIIEELEKIVGKDNILVSEESIEPYSHDETPRIKVMPKVVVKPANREEISEIMRLANFEKIPVIPRGGGTGLSGGAVPSSNGIVISFERMNKIKEIDTENLMAVVEPGVITGELSKEVEKSGLLYPPDPASLDSCTIGGNIAECAGGARAVKYGTTKNYVVGLEAVLPQGEIIKLGGKLVKNVTGYDLIGILIGSEGTLALVTEATLRLLPMPKVKVDLLIPYNDIEYATNTATEIIRHKIVPTAIEFMEKEAIKAAEQFLCRGEVTSPLPFSEASAQLLIEIDGNRKEEVEKDYEEIGEIALKNGAIDVLVAEDKGRQDKLWEGRRCISDALKSEGKVISEDVVVPRNKIPILLKNMKILENKYKFRIVSFGHVGDGNVHVNILRDTPVILSEANNLDADREWEQRIPKLIHELFKVVISLGGMISGEHGIGLTKKPYLSMAVDREQIEIMKQIKKVFDPNNILNPGKIFDV